MDSSSSRNLSLFVGGTVDVEGLEGWNWLGWKEEMLDERGVDEISCGPTVYKGSGSNGSRSVL